MAGPVAWSCWFVRINGGGSRARARARNNKTPSLGFFCACLNLSRFWRVTWGVAMANRLETRVEPSYLAERAGFEPAVGISPHTLSRRAT